MLSEEVKKAKMLAEFHHRNQQYDIFPYIKHIEDVVSIGEKFDFNNHLIVCCYLHDIVEDCSLSISKIRRYFGDSVANVVASVTDPIDLPNRKAKKKVVYNKLQKDMDEGNFESIKVKLADRIANVQNCKEYNPELLSMYKKEYPEFKDKLYRESTGFNDCLPGMWKLLDTLIGYGC